MIKEEWKYVVGFPDYQVSNLGNVKSFKRSLTGRLMSPYVGKGGYLLVQLRVSATEANTVQVHRLVLTAFNRERSPHEICRHLNGDPTDNRLSNLKWGTTKENSADMLLHGTRLEGERHPDAKLDSFQVACIREFCHRGGKLKAAGEMFGVTADYISHIVRRTNWKRLPTTPSETLGFKPRRGNPEHYAVIEPSWCEVAASLKDWGE